MNPVKYFENMPVSVPEQLILMRMGYKKGKTEIDAEQNIKIKAGIQKGSSLCVLKTAYLILKIISNDGNKIVLENELKLESVQLAKLLGTATEAVLMAATTGAEVVRVRDEEIQSGDAVLGVIIDATASETADAGLDAVQDLISKTLIRTGKKLTRRYSPGYGDLNLSEQKKIHETLALTKIGIDINNRYILSPEKSVLAIAGVE
ncbi:MAG: methionine synthase [bacterium]